MESVTLSTALSIVEGRDSQFCRALEIRAA